MNRDDYLEDEWPEESSAERETPAEEEESDWGLYTYDTAPSEEKDCVPKKRTPYADLAIDYGLSSPESAQRICEQALKKLQVAIEQSITKELSLLSRP